MATTLNNIEFNQHPSGVGFQGELVLGGWYSINVICGPSVYTQEGADVAEKANVLDYTTFEYLQTTPETTEATSPSDWIGPVTAAQLNQVIAEMEYLVENPPAGSGGA